MSGVNRVLIGVSVVAVVIAIAAVFELGDARVGRALARAVPPPLENFVQSVDLTKIESVHALDERTLAVLADGGKRFTMEFTEPCEGLTSVTDVSLVTEDSRDLDKFVGIVVNGRLCTFKDFRPGV